jgi:hypothetical protein
MGQEGFDYLTTMATEYGKGYYEKILDEINE